MDRTDLTFFRPGDSFAHFERNLPHWIQEATLCFVTWRTRDALPAHVLEQLDVRIAKIFQDYGLNPRGDWRLERSRLTPRKRRALDWKLFRVRDRFQDRGYGACPFRHPELA